MTRPEPHGLVFMFRREDRRYNVACSCGWAREGSVPSFFDVCRHHADHQAQARRVTS